MEERSEGIVLRTRPLTDTSLVVQWLTPDLGRIATVAKGARRPKSPFAGKLDLCFEARFLFMRSRRSELHTLREIVVADTHSALRKDFALLHQAAYFTILLEQGTERETPLPELHALLADYLRNLPKAECRPEAMFAFEFQFLSILGLEPAIQPSEAVQVLKSNFADLIALTRPVRIELNRQLRTAIGTTLERLPPQRERAIEALRTDRAA